MMNHTWKENIFKGYPTKLGRQQFFFTVLQIFSKLMKMVINKKMIYTQRFATPPTTNQYGLFTHVGTATRIIPSKADLFNLSEIAWICCSTSRLIPRIFYHSIKFFG